MTQSTALVTVVSGPAYFDFAEAMFESAREHFHPTDQVRLLMLEGREGWPAATMFRHHVLLGEMPITRFVYLIDADMLFVDDCGPEILPPRGLGITATLHPGYVGHTPAALPYERNPESAAFMQYDEGAAYYAGGFVGGERMAMRILSKRVAQIIDVDQMRGHTPVWHDESALNRALWSYPPDRELSPAFCAPEDSRAYQAWWPEDYRAQAKLVALDKTTAVRGER